MRPIFFLIVSLSFTTSASSQQISRHELALGVAASTDHPLGGIPEFSSQYQRALFAGPEARYSFNLSRNIAVESQISDSINAEPTEGREGGHQLLALAGLKAGVRFGKFGFFGTSSAGVASFSRGFSYYTSPNTLQYQRVTHFAIQQGIAVEYSPTPRLLLRVDAAELLNAQFRRVFYSSPQIQITSFASVPYHLTTSITVGRRFGGLQELDAPADGRKTHGYSIGGLYAMGIQEHLLEYDVRATGGGGAWIGFPLWKFISGDVFALDEPHDDHTANYQDGGSIFAAFAGPKIGFRKGPVGLYAKARPGIKRYSRTNDFQELTRTAFLAHNSPTVDFALDTGLVMEYTPLERTLRHLVVRFEGGSTYDFYNAKTVSYQDAVQAFQMPPTTIQVPSQRHSSLLFLTGVGFTF